MRTSWTTLKTFVDTFSLSVKWIDMTDYYYLRAVEGTLDLECELFKDDTDIADFETNYKNKGNQPSIQNTSIQSKTPYGAKTLQVNGVTKKLFARFTGQQYPVTTGTNTLTFEVTYPWAKILGVEAVNCEALDTVDFKVLDTPAGTYSTIPNAVLNQFSFTLNLAKDFYQKMAQFDADLYAGMVVQMTYVSKSDKTIGINFLLDEVK